MRHDGVILAYDLHNGPLSRELDGMPILCQHEQDDTPAHHHR